LSSNVNQIKVVGEKIYVTQVS